MRGSARALAWGAAAMVLAGGGLLAGGTSWARSQVTAAPMAEEAPPAEEAALDLALSPNKPRPKAGAVGGSPPTVATRPPAESAAGAVAPAVPGTQAGISGPTIGLVTAISAEPAGFTVQTEAGESVIYTVRSFTVFAAGPARPYNFGLLKVGDSVRVRGGLMGARLMATLENPEQGAAPEPKPGARGGQGGRGPGAAEPRQLVARSVIVRAGGEGRREQAARQKGAADGAGQ